MDDNDDVLRARINGETATIAWRELQRFFAQGIALSVAEHLDLVEVACQMSRDNAEQVAAWLDSAEVNPVSDSQARDWLACEQQVWSVVVRPWVLVQPVTGASKSPPVGG